MTKSSKQPNRTPELGQRLVEAICTVAAACICVVLLAIAVRVAMAIVGL